MNEMFLLRVFPFSSSLFWRLPIVCDPKEVNNGDPSVMTRENQDVKKSSRTKGVEQGKGRQPAKYSYRLKIVEIKRYKLQPKYPDKII